MIKLGICTGVENIGELAKIGFDYIELGLAIISELSQEEFEKVAQAVDASPIKAEAFNGMLPGTLKVVGDEVNAQAIHDYLDKAFARAKRLGGKVVVFRSEERRVGKEC